jgi:hypothetical protein
MNRILAPMRTLHPAFRLYAMFLRDAFFVVDAEDVQVVLNNATERGLVDNNDTEAYKRKHWTSIIQNCRRMVPDGAKLLERFDRVNTLFARILDQDGKSLFTEKVWDAVRKLKVHMKKGCFSDIAGIPLYHRLRPTQSGLPRYRYPMY